MIWSNIGFFKTCMWCKKYGQLPIGQLAMAILAIPLAALVGMRRRLSLSLSALDICFKRNTLTHFTYLLTYVLTYSLAHIVI